MRWPVLGYQVDRIGNVKRLIERLAAGERWDAVFNYCEGLKGLAREAQAPVILEVYDIPYVFSDPLTMAVTLDKAMAKRIVRDCGVPTADFAVIERIGDVENVRLPFPLFLKPVAEGSGKGIGTNNKVADRDAMRATAADLLARFHQPVLAETLLPGREFTVAITGTGDRAEVLGVSEIVPLAGYHGDGYGLVNKEDWIGRLDIVGAPPAEAKAAGRRGARRMAGVALVSTGGASTFAAMPPASRTSSRSIRWRACARTIPTCAFRHARRTQLSGPDRQDHGLVPQTLSGAERLMRILVLHSDIAPDAPLDELDTLYAAGEIAKVLEKQGHAVEQAAFTEDPDRLQALLDRVRATSCSTWSRGSTGWAARPRSRSACWTKRARCSPAPRRGDGHHQRQAADQAPAARGGRPHAGLVHAAGLEGPEGRQDLYREEHAEDACSASTTAASCRAPRP